MLALIESQYFGLLRLLRQKLRDEHLAADALNQALVTTLEHLNSGRIADPRSIGGYVYQVAMNQIRNHRRRMDERVSARADPDALNDLSDQDTSATQLAEAGTLARIRSVIEALPSARDREIVKRFYLDEEEKDAICRDLSLSALHFDKVIFRARQRMRVLLEAKGLRKGDFFSVFVAILAPA